MDFFSFSLDTHRYEGLAVVRRETIKSIYDLQDKKSCHTGYWRTAGWHIPVSNVS